MIRAQVLSAVVGVCILGALVPLRRDVQAAGQVPVHVDVGNAAARLAVRPTTPQQAIADVQRLTGGYRSLVPLAGRFGPADYALNRDLARRSLLWLGRASFWYPRDPLAARAFMDAYDTIGGFYRGQGRFYYPGAYVAYAGATRLARRLAMAGLYDWSEREYLRYALAYGSLAVLDGTLVGRWTLPGDLPADAPAAAPAATPLKPTELPRIDAAGLTPAQREAWTDVRDRFRSVSTQVHNARVLLDQLSTRLRGQGLELHPQNAADALNMQGFLEDAVDHVNARDFEQAVEALRRADYQRTKLKGVTGQ